MPNRSQMHGMTSSHKISSCIYAVKAKESKSVVLTGSEGWVWHSRSGTVPYITEYKNSLVCEIVIGGWLRLFNCDLRKWDRWYQLLAPSCCVWACACVLVSMCMWNLTYNICACILLLSYRVFHLCNANCICTFLYVLCCKVSCVWDKYYRLIWCLVQGYKSDKLTISKS